MSLLFSILYRNTNRIQIRLFASTIIVAWIRINAYVGSVIVRFESICRWFRVRFSIFMIFMSIRRLWSSRVVVCLGVHKGYDVLMSSRGNSMLSIVRIIDFVSCFNKKNKLTVKNWILPRNWNVSESGTQSPWLEQTEEV